LWLKNTKMLVEGTEIESSSEIAQGLGRPEMAH
jgi:hypothetical protein